MGRKKNDRSSRGKEQSRGANKRRESHLNQRLLVILACEDSKSSRYYFEALFDLLKIDRTITTTSCVFATHQHTNPTGVLTDLKVHRTVTGKTYKDYDHRWIVIDRDEERCGGGGHTLSDFNDALSQAENNKPPVQVAWSNPCFEIWYLLHAQYRDAALTRDQLPALLKTQLGGIYDKADRSIFGRLPSDRKTACQRAKKLHLQAQQAGISPADSNPGTTVYELVELLEGLMASEE